MRLRSPAEAVLFARLPAARLPGSPRRWREKTRILREYRPFAIRDFLAAGSKPVFPSGSTGQIEPPATGRKAKSCEKIASRSETGGRILRHPRPPHNSRRFEPPRACERWTQICPPRRSAGAFPGAVAEFVRIQDLAPRRRTSEFSRIQLRIQSPAVQEGVEMNVERMTTASSLSAQVPALGNGKFGGKNGSVRRGRSIVCDRRMMLSSAPRRPSAVEKRKTAEKSRVSTPSALGEIRPRRPRSIEGSAEVRPAKTSNCLGKTALFSCGEENLCARPSQADARSWRQPVGAKNAKSSEKRAGFHPARRREPLACPVCPATSARTGYAASLHQNQRNSREKRHSPLADERQLVHSSAQRTRSQNTPRLSAAAAGRLEQDQGWNDRAAGARPDRRAGPKTAESTAGQSECRADRTTGVRKQSPLRKPWPPPSHQSHASL